MARRRRAPTRALPTLEGPRCAWCDGVSANPSWGDGNCSACHGAGRIPAAGRTRPCPRCKGSGRCPECGGHGMADVDALLTDHDELSLVPA